MSIDSSRRFKFLKVNTNSSQPKRQSLPERDQEDCRLNRLISNS